MNILPAVTQGNSRIRRKGQEGGIYTVRKITVKMSWICFANNLHSLCDTENCEFFGVLRHSKLQCLTVLLFLAFGKRNM